MIPAVANLPPHGAEALTDFSVLRLAALLEAMVGKDISEGRVCDGTTTLLAAANELRRRDDGPMTDAAIAAAVWSGQSLRAAASSFGVGVGRVRGACARHGVRS